LRKGWIAICIFFLSVGQNLWLRGQQESYTPTAVANHFPTSLYVTASFPRVLNPLNTFADTLKQPLGLLDVSYGVHVLEVAIDRDWKFITLTETVDGEILKIPFTAPLEWYYTSMLDVNQRINFLNAFHQPQQEEQTAATRRGGKSIEVVGVDIGELGRVSLRVRGNVNISGKMVFQDQELIQSNLNQTQNTHIEFDQKQNLNIEGKIGDRISVLMDQDSERDFDWENNIRLTYEGDEDDILQKVEAGNISLNLQGTNFVNFSGPNKEGLFGLKALSKLGPLDITTIASIEQTKNEQQKYDGTSQSQTQKIQDYNYVKNQYFFIHEWFRDGVDTSLVVGTDIKFIKTFPFYPLDNGAHRVGNVVVQNFELYKLDASTDASTDPGVARVDVEHPDENKDQTGNYKRLEQGPDYILDSDLGFVRLRSPMNTEVLGCTFILVNRDDKSDMVYTVGHGITATDSTVVLKMLKPRNSDPDHPTWPLMFKNVYNLGVSNINKEGFAVRIVDTRATPQSDRNKQGIPFLTLFGLDSLDEGSQRQSDELIDIANGSILNLVTGELIFPAFYPFIANTDSTPGGISNPDLAPLLGTGKMYFSLDRNAIMNENRFIIEVDYTNQSSTIVLGGFGIVEGSEQVYKDGVPLKRGIDYQIDYFTGTINLTDEPSPTSEIKVLYDKYELVSFDKKTILGTRAQLDLGERSFLGATALYYDQSVINEKIEVGYEPVRNFIWDMNGRYEWSLEGLTKALDRLPIIETDRLSSFSIEGELAQVLPNPNPINNRATGDPNGVAYIDDFEGAKRSTSIPIQRRFWKPASPPLNPFTRQPQSQKNRSRLYWYNPFLQERTKNIWPNQSTSIRAQNETTDILVLHVMTRALQHEVPPDSIWTGIMTPLYSGDYDQTTTKYFEIWLNSRYAPPKTKITVDLGRISEDWNEDGRLNTEDRSEAGIVGGDGLLDDEEDVGLDGCRDPYEDGYGGCLDTTYVAALELPEYENVVYNGVDKEIDDPNHDNWSYKEGSNDYTHINGTENNALDGARYPDTEDLDQTGFLDKTNDYFTKTFSLDDSVYFVEETKHPDGTPTGWRLFRIPLTHFEKYDTTASQEWNDIQTVRLAISNVGALNGDTTATVKIAKMELVGNEWQELGITADSTNVFKQENADSIFAISLVNTEDNPSYVPPRGVKGEYDRINEIRSKEQSLVMEFTDLPPDYRGAAMKTLVQLSGDRAKSYLTYRRMKMFVYGEDSPWIGENETQVNFFLRFGFGDAYYELNQPVYQGWDETKDRNAINLDLNWLARLKIQNADNVIKFRETDSVSFKDNLIEYWWTDENGNKTGKYLRIVGKPALSRIQYFLVGVHNTGNEPVTGEIWLDELRLSGVKKDKGVAMRIQSRFNLADIAQTNFVYNRQGADFHVLQQRLGKNSTQEKININTTLQFHKLLPKSWGLSIPMNAAFNRSIRRPKYYPDSDIPLNQKNVPDSLLTQSQGITFSTSIAKTSKSDNRLIKYTLDRIKTSLSAAKSIASNINNSEVLNESYSGKINYSFPFSRDNYITPFKWLSPVPWLGIKIAALHLYYSPQTINTNLDVSEKLSQVLKRIGGRAPDVYNLGLNRNFSLDYNLTDNVKSKYSRSMKSDLRDYRGYAWMALRDLDPGIVTNISENLSASFNPTLISWLRPKFNYSAGYRWNKERTSNINGANIGTQLRFSSSLSLVPTQIIELFYKPPAKAPPPSRRRRRPRPSTAPKPETKPAQKEIPVLTKLHTVMKKVSPINFTYTENLNRTSRGVQGDVPLGYRFGWLPEHGLPYDTVTVGSNVGTWDHKRDLSLRSGINFSRNISTSFIFTENVSTTISSSNVEQRTMTRDYLSYGKMLEKGFPFFGWNLRWSGLEKWPLFKLVARSASLEHGFSGNESHAWQFENFEGPAMPLFGLDNFIAEYQEFERSSKKKISFAPLVGLTMNLKKGISLTIRHNQSRKVEISTNGGIRVSEEKSTNATSNYSHRGGIRIPLIYFNDINIQNTVNFTFNLDMSESRTKQSGDGGITFTQNVNTGWKAGLRISYSFTSRVSGGLVYEYRENKTETTGRKIDRDFGFDVNIAISG